MIIDITAGYTKLYRTMIYRDGENIEARVYDTPKAARYYGTMATAGLDDMTFKVFRLDVEVYANKLIPNSKAEALRSVEVE